MKCHLKILNSFYPFKAIHKHTWEKPTLGQGAIIYYFIKKQRSFIKILKCRVKEGPNVGSDHYMHELKAVLPFQTNYPLYHLEVWGISETTGMI